MHGRLPLGVDVLVAARRSAALVMKKFAGMMPPTFVCDDDGKNGVVGPPPSPSIVTGVSSGLTMRCLARNA